MELTRKQVIDILENKVFPCLKNSEWGTALAYAISSLKADEAYQIMYEGGEIFTKADMVAMLTELQVEIKELWDSRYDVWLDNQYYIGKSDTLGEVDEVIQQKINSLKENT